MLREDATYDIFVELDAKGVRDLLGDAQVAEFGVAGLRGFIFTIAAISSRDGPLGPGLRRRAEEEKSDRYFRSINALWNLSSVAGLMSAPSCGMRWGLTNSVVSPSTNRSSAVRLGARCLDRLLISS